MVAYLRAFGGAAKDRLESLLTAPGGCGQVWVEWVGGVGVGRCGWVWVWVGRVGGKS